MNNATKWDHRRFATLDDPAHKSDLNNIAGPYGCLRSFEFGKRSAPRDDTGRVSGKMVAGTAVHETIARALSNPELRDGLVSGDVQPSLDSVARVYDDEIEKAAEGREIAWGRKDNPEKIRDERVAMAAGVLCDLHNHVAEIIACEPAFIAPLGGYWTSGHLDLIYRPRSAPDTIAISDWKTGAQLPPQILLDHGFESGLYSNATMRGIFIRREDLAWSTAGHEGAEVLRAEHEPTGTVVTGESRFSVEREVLETALQTTVRKLAEHYGDGEADLADAIGGHEAFAEFPSEIRYVHLGDYVPYARKGAKTVDRAEAAEFFGVERGEKVSYQAGDRRGPAWYRMQRTEHDVPRLETLVRKLAGVVRLGRFFESIGDKCARCSYREPCLNSGYDARGDDLVHVKDLFRELGKAKRVS